MTHKNGVKLTPTGPNTTNVDPLPLGWPAKGLRGGQEIDLLEAQRTLNSAELATVLVDVPGIGPSYPWRQSEVHIGDDGKLYI